MLFGSLVELHVDCIHVYVFLFLKNCFCAISTTLWHLSIPGLSIELFNFFLSQTRQLLDSSSIHRESFCLPNSCSIALRSIELLFAVDTLDNCSIIAFVDPFKAWHLLTPLDLSKITELLYIGSARFGSHFSRSLSILIAFSPPKTSLSHSKLQPQGFFDLDQVFLHLVRVLILLFHAFHAFGLTFWDFLKILGFFKIDEVIVKFLGWVLYFLS